MKTIKTKKYLIFFLLSLFFSFGISEFLILTGKIKISVLDNYPTYTPSPSEVVISFYGGLGNNMFQYAAGLSYAKQHNKSLKIAGNFKNISKVFFVSENDYVKGWPLTEKAYIERDASLDFQDAMNNSSFQYLNGYFQDENIYIADMYGFLKQWDESKYIDHVHLTAESNKVLGKYVTNVILDILKK